MLHGIRIKFRCTDVTKSVDSSNKVVYTARFSAVTERSKENAAFFAYTPWGKLDFGTYKEDQFEPGRYYFLDITLAHPTEAEKAQAIIDARNKEMIKTIFGEETDEEEPVGSPD